MGMAQLAGFPAAVGDHHRKLWPDPPGRDANDAPVLRRQEAGRLGDRAATAGRTILVKVRLPGGLRMCDGSW